MRSRSSARQRADEKHAEHWPEQVEAAAHRGPDHEVGGKPEARDLRRHQPLLRRVDRAADAGEQSADAERHRLQRVGVEAEQRERAARFARAHATGRRWGGREPRADPRARTAKRDRRDVVGGGEARRGPGRPGMPFRPLKPPVTSFQACCHLERKQRQRERDHREVRPALAAPAKHQQADAVTRAGPTRRRRAAAAREPGDYPRTRSARGPSR